MASPCKGYHFQKAQEGEHCLLGWITIAQGKEDFDRSYKEIRAILFDEKACQEDQEILSKKLEKIYYRAFSIHLNFPDYVYIYLSFVILSFHTIGYRQCLLFIMIHKFLILKNYYSSIKHDPHFSVLE